MAQEVLAALVVSVPTPGVQRYGRVVSGEWHSNHHLYPKSARAGFLGWQLDTAWLEILAMAAVGVVKGYRDARAKFITQHYAPYLKRRSAERVKRAARVAEHVER
jgi:sn-1 stearoyl-lipid 9-desaturase